MYTDLAQALEEMYLSLIAFRKIAPSYFYLTSNILLEVHRQGSSSIFVYLCIAHDPIRLCIYENWNTCLLSRHLMTNQAQQFEDRFHHQEMLPEFSTDHIMVTFHSKDMIPKDQHQACAEVAKKHRIRITGPNAYPCILVCQNQAIQSTQLQPEQAYRIQMAAEVSKAFLEHIKEHPGEGLYRNLFSPFLWHFRFEDGHAQFLKQEPLADELHLPTPDLKQVDMKTASSLKKRGDFASCMVNSFESIYYPGKETMLYPYVFSLLPSGKSDAGFFLAFRSPENDQEWILNHLITQAQTWGYLPARMHVAKSDVLSQSLFAAFCQRLGITLMTDISRVQNASETMLNMLASSNQNRKHALAPASFIIRVSLRKDRYRDIQISSTSTFAMLSETILEAFDFDDDHLYRFSITRDGITRDYQGNALDHLPEGAALKKVHPDDLFPHYTGLEDAGLQENLTFTYLYDFGDQWLFQCKVLSRLAQKTDRPKIVSIVGESPEQYKSTEELD